MFNVHCTPRRCVPIRLHKRNERDHLIACYGYIWIMHHTLCTLYSVYHIRFVFIVSSVLCTFCAVLCCVAREKIHKLTANAWPARSETIVERIIHLGIDRSWRTTGRKSEMENKPNNHINKQPNVGGESHELCGIELNI